MGDALVAIFCTLVVAAGWFYLARSRTVDALQAFESPRRNRTRRSVRRLGAWAMIMAAAAFFWMMVEFKRELSPPRQLLSVAIVALTLTFMMFCAGIDLYLTHRMRRTNGRPKL